MMDKFFGLDNPAKVDKDIALLTTTHDDGQNKQRDFFFRIS